MWSSTQRPAGTGEVVGSQNGSQGRPSPCPLGDEAQGGGAGKGWAMRRLLAEWPCPATQEADAIPPAKWTLGAAWVQSKAPGPSQVARLRGCVLLIIRTCRKVHGLAPSGGQCRSSAPCAGVPAPVLAPEPSVKNWVTSLFPSDTRGPPCFLHVAPALCLSHAEPGPVQSYRGLSAFLAVFPGCIQSGQEAGDLAGSQWSFHSYPRTPRSSHHHPLPFSAAAITSHGHSGGTAGPRSQQTQLAGAVALNVEEPPRKARGRPYRDTWLPSLARHTDGSRPTSPDPPAPTASLARCSGPVPRTV